MGIGIGTVNRDRAVHRKYVRQRHQADSSRTADNGRTDGIEGRERTTTTMPTNTQKDLRTPTHAPQRTSYRKRNDKHEEKKRRHSFGHGVDRIEMHEHNVIMHSGSEIGRQPREQEGGLGRRRGKGGGREAHVLYVWYAAMYVCSRRGVEGGT